MTENTQFGKEKEKQKVSPGKEHRMHEKPEIIRDSYKGTDKLKNKVALITGGDSGIGRSVAVHFAREGANIAFVYLNEDKDAGESEKQIREQGGECLVIKGDLKDEQFCRETVEKVRDHFGGINILVNNAGEHYPKDDIEEISSEQFEITFKTNIFSFFYLTQQVLRYMKKGDSIINTGSVTSYRGSSHLLDYSSTKGAIVSFTRSLAKNLAEEGIRVNAVAPGPIWTPLVVASFDNLDEFGNQTPMKRPGQPSEVGPAYVLLASEDGSYITGQVIHINGGEIVGG